MSIPLVHNRKMLISGPLVEVIESWQCPRFRSDNFKQKNPESVSFLFDSVRRSVRQFERLTYANAWAFRYPSGNVISPRFLTLTFSNDVRDLSVANYEFKKFTQSLDYRLDKVGRHVEFLTVPQFTKAGRVHFHSFMFNMPFLKDLKSLLGDCWKGFLRFNSVDSVAGSVRYASRYMVRDMQDVRFVGKKRYFGSYGLKRPVVVDSDVDIELLGDFLTPKYGVQLFSDSGRCFGSFGEYRVVKFMLPNPVNTPVQFKRLEQIVPSLTQVPVLS